MKKKAKEDNRDYSEANIWDLANPATQPLKDFLQAHF